MVVGKTYKQLRTMLLFLDRYIVKNNKYVKYDEVKFGLKAIILSFNT